METIDYDKIVRRSDPPIPPEDFLYRFQINSNHRFRADAAFERKLHRP